MPGGSNSELFLRCIGGQNDPFLVPQSAVRQRLAPPHSKPTVFLANETHGGSTSSSAAAPPPKKSGKIARPPGADRRRGRAQERGRGVPGVVPVASSRRAGSSVSVPVPPNVSRNKSGPRISHASAHELPAPTRYYSSARTNSSAALVRSSFGDRAAGTGGDPNGEGDDNPDDGDPKGDAELAEELGDDSNVDANGYGLRIIAHPLK